jgi:uncharacterized membrane protein YgcG
MRIGIITLAIFSCITTLFAQSEKANWQEKPIMVDGVSTDWGENLRFFNGEAKLHFEYRNDDQNLYLILLSSERSTINQILKAGCSVNLKAKKSISTNATITIPGHSSQFTESDWIKPNGLPDKLVEKSVTKSMVLKDTVILDGFQFSAGVLTSDIKIENRISFAKNKVQRNQYIYEFCIPLCELFGNKYILKDINVIPFQFQIIINELSVSIGEKTSHRTANRSESIMSNDGGTHSGGMHSGGGMRGGGMRGGGQEMGESLRSHKDDMPFDASMPKRKILNTFYFSSGK